jgi:hypothetical protein
VEGPFLYLSTAGGRGLVEKDATGPASISVGLSSKQDGHTTFWFRTGDESLAQLGYRLSYSDSSVAASSPIYAATGTGWLRVLLRHAEPTHADPNRTFRWQCLAGAGPLSDLLRTFQGHRARYAGLERIR